VIELTQGVTVRRYKSKTDSGVFRLAGLALTCSKPAMQGFFVRGRPTESIEHHKNVRITPGSLKGMRLFQFA